MKKILLLLLLTVLFAGCKKKDENENSRIVGKWELVSMTVNGKYKDCNPDWLKDEFKENGEYFGFLPSGKDDKQASGTYILKDKELKIFYNGEEKILKLIDLRPDISMSLEEQSHNIGVRYTYIKSRK